MEAITMQEKVIKKGKAQGLYTVASQSQVHSRVLSSWKRGQEIPAVNDCSKTCMCTHRVAASPRAALWHFKLVNTGVSYQPGSSLNSWTKTFEYANVDANCAQRHGVFWEVQWYKRWGFSPRHFTIDTLASSSLPLSVLYVWICFQIKVLSVPKTKQC